VPRPASSSVRTKSTDKLLLTANRQFNLPPRWATLFVFGVLGMVHYSAVMLAKEILMPWAADNNPQPLTRAQTQVG
jgi:hypothetical protein